MVFVSVSLGTKCETTSNYYVSFNFYKDLSDTYRGGNLLSGGLSIVKSWYGTEITFGYFHSHSSYLFNISIEEINKSIQIPVDELAIMNQSSISFLFRPINSKRISADFLVGMVLGYARNSILKSVYYNYDLAENQFSYLYRDYQLIKRDHFGFQFGFNLKLEITKTFDFQVSSRIQDLSNGGTFFFVGSGFCFKLYKKS